ncbi:hypothetical protein [Terrabacter carboxydivorans]
MRVDLHALLELVDAGCPPELAARILSPLDETTPAEGWEPGGATERATGATGAGAP